MKYNPVFFIPLILLFFQNPAMANKKISGVVYNDVNKNGKLDKNEPGINDVLVSNQINVVKTDEDGSYILPVREEMILFVSKPAAYNLPLNEKNLPQFYYIHQPQGSPKNMKFPGIAPTGPLPAQINFPLYKTTRHDTFKAIITGDPQPRDSVEVGYYRDDIVTEMVGTDAQFYMALGDIAYDNLEIYEQYNRAVAQIGVPAYNVHGNHDMNYHVINDRYASETFKNIFGPPYYSFDYGKVHFIVMDNVDYLGWDNEKNKNGSYRGYISPEQLTWLKNDLQFINDDRLIVLSMHIPIFTAYSEGASINTVNRDELFEILESHKYLLALTAHMHFIEHLNFNKQAGWQGGSEFYSINAGAGCGAWWSGPKDERGIPVSYCMDGSPNGYFLFTFEGNQYKYFFKAAGKDSTEQMRIFSPAGVLTKSTADTTRIIVNVFNGSPGAKVYARINRKQSIELYTKNMKDPFILKYLEKREYFPSWLSDAASSSHIWIGELPDNLDAGTHLLEIFVDDPHGQKYKGKRLFEITSD